MALFSRSITRFVNELSIPGLIQIFLFLLLLLAVPLTVLSIRQTRDIRSLAAMSLTGSSGCSGTTPYVSLSWGSSPVGSTIFEVIKDSAIHIQVNSGRSYYITIPGDDGKPHTWQVSDVHGNFTNTLNITTATCTPTCKDECTSTSDRQCSSGTSYQTCGKVGSCFKWSSPVSCSPGQTCSGGSCVTSGGGTSGGGTSGGGTSGGGTSGGGTSGGKKTGGTGSTSPSYLETFQLGVSVPYLVGSMKLKAEVSGVIKELEVSPTNKNVTLDLKGTNLSLNKEYILVVTSDKTLVKKVRFTPTASSVNVDAGSLILGDLNQDNKIDSNDQLALINSISAQTAIGDLNADKDTDSLDWAILLTNFGKSGD